MAKRFMWFKDGKQRALTLSYDDGVYQDKKLVEILDKYGLKGTFNLNSGRIEEATLNQESLPGVMPKSEVKKVFENSNHEVAVHGYKHCFWNEIPTSQVVEEIMKDRTILEEMFGKRIVGGAYPFGRSSVTNDVVETLRLCGIKYCRETEPTFSFGIPKNWLRLQPTCHHNHPGLMELLQEFLNDGYFKKPKLFYLWGHSYELDFQADYWSRLEEFFKLISHKNDIFYGTNKEILL